jgi:hypothetical protein
MCPGKRHRHLEISLTRCNGVSGRSAIHPTAEVPLYNLSGDFRCTDEEGRSTGKEFLRLLRYIPQGLKCLDGHIQSASAEGNFTSSECSEGETWCMSIHTKDTGKATEDFKSCWNPAWDNGL